MQFHASHLGSKRKQPPWPLASGSKAKPGTPWKVAACIAWYRIM